MSYKNNSFPFVMSILVCIMGGFMIIGGFFSFIGGGIASFFLSSWGLKTAFGGIISAAIGLLALTAGIKTISTVKSYRSDSMIILMGAALTVLTLITLVIGLFSHSANIFDVSNLIVSGLFTYSVYYWQK